MLAWIVLAALCGAPVPATPTSSSSAALTDPPLGLSPTLGAPPPREASSPPSAPSSQPASQPLSQPSSQPAVPGSQPWLPTRATLSVEDQALGWWMTGGGTVGLLAGLATLSFTAEASGATRDLGRATGGSLLGLGIGFLLSGIYVLATAAPGPCEASGTALSGDGPQRF